MKNLETKSDNLSIDGLENYPKDAPCVIVTNHNRLTDIFYVPMAIDDYIISLISARLVYKKEPERLKIINNSLNAFPIEAHGKKAYSDLCINYATKLLESGISVNIFPEGAYLPGNDIVYKGRTGAARILFNSLENNKPAYFLPVAVNVSSIDDLDSYKISDKDDVTIKILEPIQTHDYYYNYLNGSDLKEKNLALHQLTDEAMIKIASALGRSYLDEYIELRPKGNVIFSDGSVVDTALAQDSFFINKYELELQNKVKKLIKGKN